MSKNGFIDTVSVGSPCSEDWNKMVGSDQVRMCEHCAKDVNNISEMTRKDAKRLVRASDGNICIRYMQHPVTKRPVFADQLHQITRRAPGIAAGVMAASMSLSTMAYAQETGTANESAAEPQIVSTLTKDQKQVPKSARSDGSVSGTITDQQGGVIQNASISATNLTTNVISNTSTNGEGRYIFEGLESGTYRVESTAGGFVQNSVDVTVGADSEANADLSLGIQISETLEVRSETVVVTQSFSGGISISRDYSTALARAVDNDVPEEVQDLITKGANVNGKDANYNNLTPLFLAVENGNLEIIQMLLNAGAKVNVRDKSKQTALMRLDMDATPEMISLLVRHGVKLNLSDDEGNTALDIVSGSVSTEVLQALISAGADITLANQEGKTPLMTAAQDGKIENVRILLESGANANALDKDGQNSLAYADQDEIKQLLVSYGAEARFEQPETASGNDSKAVLPR